MQVDKPTGKLPVTTINPYNKSKLVDYNLPMSLPLFKLQSQNNLGTNNQNLQLNIPDIIITGNIKADYHKDTLKITENTTGDTVYQNSYKSDLLANESTIDAISSFISKKQAELIGVLDNFSNTISDLAKKALGNQSIGKISTKKTQNSSKSSTKSDSSTNNTTPSTPTTTSGSSGSGSTDSSTATPSTSNNPFSNVVIPPSAYSTGTALTPTFKVANVGTLRSKLESCKTAECYENTLSTIKEDAAKVQLKKGTAAKALEAALNESKLGIKESDGSFKKYTQGTSGCWDAQFLNWIYETTCGGNGTSPFGYSSITKDSSGNATLGKYLSNVSDLAEWAKQQGIYINKNKVNASGSANNSTGANTVKPGDLIIIGNPQHVGIVKSIDADGTVHTVEGDADNTVKEKTWKLNDNSGEQIFGFIQMNKLETL